MHRILLASACLIATAMPALSQTLRVSLRQDLDVLDPTRLFQYLPYIPLGQFDVGTGWRGNVSGVLNAYTVA